MDQSRPGDVTAVAESAPAPAPAADEDIPVRRVIKPAVREFRRIKVLSMGDGNTGKSCLIKRFCEQRVRPD